MVGTNGVNLEPYNPNQLSRLNSSGWGHHTTEVIFVNNSTADLFFYWLDYDGTERFYGRVAACGFSIQHTSAGHTWLVKDQHGKSLAVFQAAEKTGRAFIGSAQANTLTETSDEDQQGEALTHWRKSPATSSKDRSAQHWPRRLSFRCWLRMARRLPERSSPFRSPPVGGRCRRPRPPPMPTAKPEAG